MNCVISIIHATYGRPQKALIARSMWMERAVNTDRVQYVFCLNPEDYEGINARASGYGTKIVVADFKGSAPAWNAGLLLADGRLLVQASDDTEPPQDWDLHLQKRIEWEAGPDWMNLPVFVAVCDGYRKDRLCTSAIMTRVYAEQKGSFIPPEYRSVFSDDEVTYRAYRDARDGRVKLIEARDLVFLHRHHVHDRSVPDDATYQRGNSPEAYAIGSKLFWERNPEARTDGLRTWT